MLTRETIVRPVTLTFRPWVILLFVCCPPMWGLIFLLAYGVPWESPNTPAWVQAVGSVAAILVAVWVSHREVGSQADNRLVDSYNYMHKALSVAGYGEQAVKEAADFLLASDLNSIKFEFYERLLEVSFGDLDEIRYTSIDSIDVASAFLAIKRAVAHTKASLSLVRQSGASFSVPTLQGWKANVRTEAANIETGINAYVEANPRLINLVG